MSHYIIGIDPGLDGGIAVLKDDLYAFAVPTKSFLPPGYVPPVLPQPGTPECASWVHRCQVCGHMQEPPDPRRTFTKNDIYEPEHWQVCLRIRLEKGISAERDAVAREARFKQVVSAALAKHAPGAHAPGAL